MYILSTFCLSFKTYIKIPIFCSNNPKFDFNIFTHKMVPWPKYIYMYRYTNQKNRYGDEPVGNTKWNKARTF